MNNGRSNSVLRYRCVHSMDHCAQPINKCIVAFWCVCTFPKRVASSHLISNLIIVLLVRCWCSQSLLALICVYREWCRRLENHYEFAQYCYNLVHIMLQHYVCWCTCNPLVLWSESSTEVKIQFVVWIKKEPVYETALSLGSSLSLRNPRPTPIILLPLIVCLLVQLTKYSFPVWHWTSRIIAMQHLLCVLRKAITRLNVKHVDR